MEIKCVLTMTESRLKLFKIILFPQSLDLATGSFFAVQSQPFLHKSLHDFVIESD